MRQVVVGRGFSAFRAAARALLAEGVPPEAIAWGDAEDRQALLGLAVGAAEARSGGADAGPQHSADAGPHHIADAGPHRGAPPAPPRVPAAFVRLAEDVACIRGPERLASLYRALWRLTHGEPGLLDDPLDADTRALEAMARAVYRDVHRMHAFLRFSGVAGPAGEHFVAWYAPDHPILDRALPFFVDRFRATSWTILTPDASASWDGRALRHGPGAPRSDAPQGDALEALWRTYWGAIFDPARIDTAAMHDKIPARFAARMPELFDAARVVSAAPKRVQRMLADARSPSAALVPPGADLTQLRDAARACTACPLHAAATQTVFGAGPRDARLVLVGEQPGDQEDLDGVPFIGPAGAVLDAALAEAGLDRDRLYLTNAVKHFKHHVEPGRGDGRRRIHDKPAYDDVRACFGWLEAELAQLRPHVIVLLGVTAGQALFGRSFKLSPSRGRPLPSDRAPVVLATYHPAAILRLPDADAREDARRALTEDLRAARRWAETSAARAG